MHMNHLGMFEIHIQIQWVQVYRSLWVAKKLPAMPRPPSLDHTLSNKSLECGGNMLEGQCESKDPSV